MITNDMLKTEDCLLTLSALLEGEDDPIANLANAAALLYAVLPAVNWAGFYLLRDGALVLGPFSGLPACTRIALGKGVCGTAFSENRTVVVADVHAFPGHIACDGASRSETVVPLQTADGVPFGVLDVDSPALDRFDADTVALLEAAAGIIQERTADAVRTLYGRNGA